MKNDKLLSIYFFVLFIYTAVSSTRFYISESSPSIIYPLLPAILSLIVSFQEGIKIFDRRLLLPISVLLLWNVGHYFFFHRPPTPYPIIAFFCGYVAYNAFREDFGDRFVKLSVQLSILGLVVWGLCIISYPTMRIIAETIGEKSMSVSYSLYIVNIGIKEIEFVYRNCGFCWEPGRYSCLLMLAIYLETMRNGLSWHNFNLKILILALLTTFSTTGYLALIIFIAYWLISEKKINPLYWGGAVIVVVGIMSLPFMRDKIEDLWVNEEIMAQNISNLEWRAENGQAEGYYCPQRFQAFALQQIDFVHANPFIGDSRNLANHYLNKVNNYMIVLSEGNLGIAVQYGYIIGFVLYMLLIRSSRALANTYNSSKRWLFLLLWLIINFSYNFWEMPLCIVLWMWAFFSDDSAILQEYYVENND